MQIASCLKSFLALLIAMSASACSTLRPADRSPVDTATASSCTPAFHFINPAGRRHFDLSGIWRIVPDPVREGLREDVAPQYAFHLDESDAENPPHRLKEYEFDGADQLQVPGSWSSLASPLNWYDGLVWHQRRFNADPSPGKRYFLYFGAVNYEAVVFLNGRKIGSHAGGFTPFDFEVTSLLKGGGNSLVVAVDSKHGEDTIPTARTDWWNYGGITRPPLLVETPATFLADYWLRLADDGSIAIDVRLEGPDAASHTVEIGIPDLEISASLTTDERGRASAGITPRRALNRWSPEHPALYDVRISTDSDSISDRIGFRTIKVAGDDILLNGAAVFLKGISMHEESLGRDPSRYLGVDGARAQLGIIKNELGGNFVRLAHYPHAEETLRAADELGLLVWSEIPIYWDIDFKSTDLLAAARDALCDNIMRDRNRSSVIIWSVANETPISPERNAFLSTLIGDARRLDGGRLVALASHQNRQNGDVVVVDDPLAERVDLLAANYYGGWYGGNLDDLAKVKWARRVEKPMVFSEFGAGALAEFSDPVDRRMFSVEYQQDYYEATIAMAKKIDFLRGASPWILKDFRSPRRFHPKYQSFWNRKGLIDPMGRKKPAFEVLRDWYDEIP